MLPTHVEWGSGIYPEALSEVRKQLETRFHVRDVI